MPSQRAASWGPAKSDTAFAADIPAEHRLHGHYGPKPKPLLTFAADIGHVTLSPIQPATDIAAQIQPQTFPPKIQAAANIHPPSIGRVDIAAQIRGR
jgi:hypothetical protein